MNIYDLGVSKLRLVLLVANGTKIDTLICIFVIIIYICHYTIYDLSAFLKIILELICIAEGGFSYANFHRSGS